jgi:O-antigen/teichoic acid export membrane protein
MAAENDGILARTARGAGWVVAWRMATRLLGLVSTLVLARLLVPADFGLVALATSFAFALDACLSLGVEDQIIRTPNPDRVLYDTAFTISLLRGIIVGLMVAAMAPFTATFFEEPRLVPVLLALAATTALSGAANIGVVDFRRRLEFHLEFRLLVLPRVVSILATILIAALTHSYWALIVGIVLQRVSSIAIGYAMHPYRPHLTLQAWRQLLGVSFWTWAIGMVGMLRDRSDSFVVARMVGPAGLGAFAAGSEMATVPTTELGLALNRAAMSGFAEAGRRARRSEEADAFLRLLGGLVLVTLPAGVGVSLLADAMVALALGPNWVAAGPVVAVLGVASAIAATGSLGSGWLRARAPLRQLCGILAAALLVRLALLLWLTGTMGLTGAAIAVGVGMVLEAALLVGIVAHRLHLSLTAVVQVVARPLLACLVMALGVVLLNGGGSPARILLTGVPLGMASYGATLLLAWWAAGRPAGAETDLMRGLALSLPRRRLRCGEP